MERVGRIFRSFEEARQAELDEELALTPEQRQAISKALRDRYYGPNVPDVRASGVARVRKLGEP